jgi:hypothetical protein
MQKSLFPDIVAHGEPEPVQQPEPEAPETPLPLPELDARKPFVVVKCARSSQKLIVPKSDKGCRILCQDCDPRTKAKYDPFRNIALAKALRAHINSYNK